MKKNTEYLLLFIILFIGSWLRFHNLGETSFSNDELSALTRARFTSFHELVQKGIMVDGHPALVQTMIWFTIHHFNDDVFTIRFPFAVSGIVSILLIFLLAKRWFGSATGLLSAAALAILVFPLLYSQIARPYSIGLMFSLALAYFWTRLLFDEKKSAWISIAYVLCSACCIYSHYFSFMLAGIIGVSGLFFLKKGNYVQYILLNCIPILLFIPSISIFQQQFGYEGIGGWLPAPDSSFLFRFLLYIFNQSWLVIIIVCCIFIVPAVLYFKKYSWNKFHTLSLTWFMVPFLVGYFYSIWKSPVLQYSTLLFSFPFLLLFLFSFINVEWITKKITVTLVLVMLGSGLYSTVIENKFYQTNHFGVFKELAEKTKEWDEKYGKENIVKLFSLSTPEYINYYFRRLNHEPNISVYADDERTKYGVLSSILDTAKATYFLYAWTNALHAYETPVFIEEQFQVIVERDTFFNSEITLFKRGPQTDSEKIITGTDFERNNWNYETDNRSGDFARSGLFSEKMDGRKEYGISYKNETSKLNLNSSNMLKAEAWFYAADTIRTASLVVAFTKNGEMVSYAAAPLQYFFYAKNKWTKVFLFSAIPPEDCELSVYVWNPNHETFYIDDLSIKTAPRNPLFRP
ncbi:MAG: glycosyltransferase family 39 protein [Bacteroidota bacterium]